MNQLTGNVIRLGRQISNGLKSPTDLLLENRATYCGLSSSTSRLTRKIATKSRLVSTSACYFNETKESSSSKQIDNEPDILYQRLELEVRGHDPAVLRSYEWFACAAAKHLGITVSRTWEPPKHILRQDALKSVHIFRKHIVQYEFRTYFKVIELKHLTGSTADTYLEYVQRNLPEGVAMKVTKDAINRLPEYIKPKN